MKILGIDYGTKRVGVAISNPDQTMALPRAILVNNKNLLKSLKELVESEGIQTVVVGESKTLAGKPNPIMKEIERFAEKLKKESNIEVIFEPEFYSSSQVRRTAGWDKDVDAGAATLILQTYLDKNKESS